MSQDVKVHRSDSLMRLYSFSLLIHSVPGHCMIGCFAGPFNSFFKILNQAWSQNNSLIICCENSLPAMYEILDIPLMSGMCIGCIYRATSRNFESLQIN